MSFGDRMRQRREELGLSRQELSGALGLSLSAISNYEKDISFPKAEVLLRLFDALETDPNSLFQDYFQAAVQALSTSERRLLKRYRSLSPLGREALDQLSRSLYSLQKEQEEERVEQGLREIPLYRSPAAAGYAAPVFGEDFDYLSVTKEVPAAAEFAVRIQGDSMSPYFKDGSVVYVNHDPLRSGDVGIFFVDGDILCKQYHRDRAGVVYLFSLNRARADADVVLGPESGRRLACFGRVLHRPFPLPGL